MGVVAIGGGESGKVGDRTTGTKTAILAISGVSHEHEALSCRAIAVAKAKAVVAVANSYLRGHVMALTAVSLDGGSR